MARETPYAFLHGQPGSQAAVTDYKFTYTICIGYASCGYTSSLQDSSKDVLHPAATTSRNIIAGRSRKKDQDLT